MNHVRHWPAAVAGLAGLVLLTCPSATAAATQAVPASATTADQLAGQGRGSSPAVAAVGHAVGWADVVLVDPTRPTAADPRGAPAKPDRTIPVRLLYPAVGQSLLPADPLALPSTQGAPVADGHFPLVVFSHGLTATGPAFHQLLAYFARAGYVVALPTFPLTSGPGASPADVVNQPGDVSFVIDEVLDLARDPANPLYDRVQRHRIAAAGHSVGGMTTLGVTYNSAVRDPRIDAAISFAGAEIAFPGGSYADRPGVPLHLVHGAADITIPVGASDALFASAAGPVSYLRLNTAGHIDLFFPPDGFLTLESSVAFLDVQLKHQRKAFEAVPSLVSGSGLGTWQQRP